MRENAEALAEAVSRDFGHRSPAETRLLELFPSYEAIADALKVPCSCAEDPQTNVVIGCGKAVENMQDLGQFLDDNRRRLMGR